MAVQQVVRLRAVMVQRELLVKAAVEVQITIPVLAVLVVLVVLVVVVAAVAVRTSTTTVVTVVLASSMLSTT